MSRSLQRALGTALAAGIMTTGAVFSAASTSATSAPVAPSVPSVTAQTCVPFTSDGLDLSVCANLSTPSAGKAKANGHTVEMHEYLRPDHVVEVQVQQRNAAGGWDVVAVAVGQDVECASAVTGTVSVTGPARACATGGLRGHEQATVCTIP